MTPSDDVRRVIVVPCFDEAARLDVAALADLAARADAQVLAVDDGSTDGTPELVAASPDPRVRLVPAGAPEPGWLGKPNACAQGAAAAGDTDVLVFLDADVRLIRRLRLAEARPGATPHPYNNKIKGHLHELQTRTPLTGAGRRPVRSPGLC